MRIQLKNVRLSYPNLFTPSRFDDTSEAKYSATFHIEKDSDTHKQVVDAMKAVAKEKFGEKAGEIYKSIQAKDALPLHDGDESGKDDLAGIMFIRANSKSKPSVVDANKQRLQESDGKPYAGCYVNAIVEIYAMKFNNKPQINCSLCGVQFVKDGEAFAGGRPASDDEFDSVATEFDDSF